MVKESVVSCEVVRWQLSQIMSHHISLIISRRSVERATLIIFDRARVLSLLKRGLMLLDDRILYGDEVVEQK